MLPPSETQLHWEIILCFCFRNAATEREFLCFRSIPNSSGNEVITKLLVELQRIWFLSSKGWVKTFFLLGSDCSLGCVSEDDYLPKMTTDFPKTTTGFSERRLWIFRRQLQIFRRRSRGSARSSRICCNWGVIGIFVCCFLAGHGKLPRTALGLTESIACCFLHSPPLAYPDQDGPPRDGRD